MARVLIAGCGYVGTALGRVLAAAGHEPFGLRRDPSALPREIRPVAGDLADAEGLASVLPAGIDAVAYTAAASGFADDAYRAAYVDGVAHLLDALASRGERPRRIVFTSSTGVYAQQGGEWVDEASPTEPAGFSGTRLLEGERLLAAGPFPATALRLGGIYGPGRTSLLERVRQGVATCREGAYTNRIHRDDCAGALAHLLFLPAADLVYVGVDEEPAEECTALRWIAARLGAPAPRHEPAGAGAPGARVRGSKRCSSARLRGSGYRFRYPTYREGYGALIEALAHGGAAS